MRKLVLGSLFAVLATQATGCIITSDDGDDFATINAEWSFHTVNPTGQSLSPPNACPAGFNTVALHNQLVDANFRPIGPEVIDLFDCIDMRNFTDELEPGVYETFISVTSGSGGTIYADSLIDTIDVTVADDTFRAQIIDNGGYFKIGWDLREQGTNAPLTCREVRAGDAVGLTATLTSNTAIFVDDDFDCEEGEEFFTFSKPVAKGTYDVAIEPVDSTGASIGPSVVLDDKVMGDRNAVSELGVVTLLFP